MSALGTTRRCHGQTDWDSLVFSFLLDDGPPGVIEASFTYGSSLYEPGGTLSFSTGAGGRQARKSPLIERAGVLTLLVQQESLPYKCVAVEGTVVRTDRPPRPS